LFYHPILKNYFCKIDNEGKRTPAQGAQSKLMGLRPGVSDLFIYFPTEFYAGLWLEIKQDRRYTNSEKLTKTWIAQEAFIEAVRDVGYYADFCYGWEDGKRIVENYLEPVISMTNGTE